jgi:hypothetical protein
MSAELWMMVAVGGFVCAAIMLAVAVIAFFRLNIIGVYGIVSGKTASKEIARVWAVERARYAPESDLGFFRRRQAADALVAIPANRASANSASARLGKDFGPPRGKGGPIMPSDALSAMQLSSGIGRRIGDAFGGRLAEPGGLSNAQPEETRALSGYAGQKSVAAAGAASIDDGEDHDFTTMLS